MFVNTFLTTVLSWCTILLRNCHYIVSLRGTPLGPALRRSLSFLRDVYLVEIPLKGVGKGRDKLQIHFVDSANSLP